MITIKAFILAPLWGVGIVSVGLMSYVIGPDVEQRFFPVITDQSYAGVTRTSGRVCWDWTYTKRREVTLERKALYIERPDGIHFPVDEIRPDLGIPSNNSTTAKAGVTRTIPECVTVPVAVRAVPSFVVRGVSTYRPLHTLWTLHQPLIPVVVDGPARAPDP